MNKRTNKEQIISAMKAAHAVSMPVKNQLIFGYPGETAETLKETVQLMKDVDDPGRRMLFICPIPGTKLYERSKKAGLIGDEYEYLKKIKTAVEKNIPIVNFTSFPIAQLENINNYYLGLMKMNFILNKLKNPSAFFTLLVRHPKGFVKLILKSLYMTIFKNAKIKKIIASSSKESPYANLYDQQ